MKVRVNVESMIKEGYMPEVKDYTVKSVIVHVADMSNKLVKNYVNNIRTEMENEGLECRIKQLPENWLLNAREGRSLFYR